MTERTPITRCEELKERDRWVLQLLAENYSAEEIARETGLKSSTVRNLLRNDHPSSIFQKIGVDNRMAAVVWYVQHCQGVQEQTLVIFSPFRTFLTAVYGSVIVFLFVSLRLLDDVRNLPHIYSNIFAVLPASAGVYGLLQLRRMTNNTNLCRPVMRWFSLGLIAWSIGQLLWVLWIFLYQDDVPFPSAADIGYLTSAAYLVVGMYFLNRGLYNGSMQKGITLSVFLITVSVLCTFWARGGRIDLEGDPIKLFFDIAYPTFDAIGIGMLVPIIYSESFSQIGRQMQQAVYWITIGTFVFYLADASFSITTSLSEGNAWAFYNGSLSDILFTTAFWILGIGVTWIPRLYKRKTA